MASKKTIIVGLDPGLADTGYGIIAKEGSRLSFIAAGSIRTAAGQDFPRRLEQIYEEMDALLQRYQPDLVAIEKLFFAKNVKTALAVGQARGVILLCVRRHSKRIMEFTPLQIKQGIASSGAASKRQVGLMVKTILSLQAVSRTDDAADALALAITAAFTNPRLR